MWARGSAHVRTLTAVEALFEEHFYILTLLPTAAITTCHKLGDSKKKFILSQFLRLEVQNQSVNGAIFHLEVLGQDPPLCLPSGACQQSSILLGL